MLIALAGRKSSGKTTLTKEIFKRGFKKISFAFKLKELVAELYNWNIVDLYSAEGKEEKLANPVSWDLSKCEILSELVNKKINFLENKIFYKRRDALQFIGTDVIRQIDNNFHVNALRNKILENPNINYVIDDLRFPNELSLVKDLGGLAIYVMRPFYFEYDNHASEISLRRHDFEYIVMNDSSKHKLLRKFNIFLDGLLSKRKKPIAREELVKHFKESEGDTSIIAKKLQCSRDKIVWWATKFMINIDRNSYQCNHDVFSLFNEQSAYWAGIMSSDGTIKAHLKYNYLLDFSNLELELVKEFKDFVQTDKNIYTYKQKSNGKLKHSVTISSRYIADDLKLWNVEPLKSKHNKIPDCLRDKPDLLCYWIVGLIDGDGSIFVTKHGILGLNILASKEIVDYLYEFIGVKNGYIENEKGVENLYTLEYHGKYAVEVYKKIYKGIGLSRKWGQIEPFLTKKWHH